VQYPSGLNKVNAPNWFVAHLSGILEGMKISSQLLSHDSGKALCPPCHCFAHREILVSRKQLRFGQNKKKKYINQKNSSGAQDRAGPGPCPCTMANLQFQRLS
jgi:hypothetical protein